MLRIGLVQMRCEEAAVTANLESMSRYIIGTDTRGIDILGFPEMSITSYADPDRYPEAALRRGVLFHHPPGSICSAPFIFLTLSPHNFAYSRLKGYFTQRLLYYALLFEFTNIFPGVTTLQEHFLGVLSKLWSESSHCCRVFT
ncbi:MAG TPA: hypothetical protein G4O07_06370 [Dehalococcoidia bacterium]|nr:hypothetical protein [Dehalococcoidia bacterium]